MSFVVPQFGAFPSFPCNVGYNKVVKRQERPYCSVDDVLAYVHNLDLNLIDIEKQLRIAVRRAQSYIDNWTQDTFDICQRIEYYDGEGYPTIITDYYPILQLDRVDIYSVGFNTFFSYPGENMIVDNLGGIVSFPPLFYSTSTTSGVPLHTIGFSFLPGLKNVRFTYWSGYDSVPSDIVQPTALVAAALLLREGEIRRSGGTAAQSVPGQHESFGVWTRMSEKYMDEARYMASRYRRTFMR